jgi:hypothetical protein
MHPASTRNEFLRLRVQGLSLACISRRLHVSKPTLIAWSRQAQPEIAARLIDSAQTGKQELANCVTEELADLTRKLNGVKQELFSRSVRKHPTAALEAAAGDLRRRIDHLESLKSPSDAKPINPLILESINPVPAASASPNPSEPNRTPKKIFARPYARSNR